ncbi:MAG: SigE family RNA polymerase sigma factor [Rhodoglobus sp.]
MRSEHETEFEGFVRAHRSGLRAYAVLLCGDWHLAEDVVQLALIRVYRKWDQIRNGAPGAYARRAVTTIVIDQSRRGFVAREIGVADVPETYAAHSETALDPQLMAALQELPPRMRAVVVLRYVQDLSVDQVAAALGCRPGTVKSQAARGLAKLNTALTPPVARSTFQPLPAIPVR